MGDIFVCLRLKQERQRLGIEQKEIANICDVIPKTVSRWESSIPIPADKLELLVPLGFDPLYVISGHRVPQSFIAEPSAEYAVKRRADDRYAAIPLYDVHVAAGGGVIVNQEQVVDALHFRRDWIRAELHVSPEDLCLVYVQGDSMQPTLDPGDMILINHHDQRAERDGIYVLRLEGALLVKRLQRLPGGVLQVVSDNPAYQPYQLKLNELEGFDVAIVGRVVWVGRRM